jgi:hypothetical protein
LRQNKNYFARFGMKQTFLWSIFASASKQPRVGVAITAGWYQQAAAAMPAGY